MAYTSHGHQVIGTIAEAERPKAVARCGGPALCIKCSAEAAILQAFNNPQTQTGSSMEFHTFVRKPFTVEAVEVTEENIEQVAKLVGTLRKKEDGTSFIQVDRRLVPNIYRVYPGFWMTKMGDNVRCYSKRIFTEQFTQTTPDIDNWVRFLRQDTQDSAKVYSENVDG